MLQFSEEIIAEALKFPLNFVWAKRQFSSMLHCGLLRLSIKNYKTMTSLQIVNKFSISFGLKAQLNSAQGTAFEC